MNTANPESAIEQIGRTAGLVWHHLRGTGPKSMTGLIKAIGAPRDMVILAIGWLAREDKLTIEETKRGRIITLRD